MTSKRNQSMPIHEEVVNEEETTLTPPPAGGGGAAGGAAVPSMTTFKAAISTMPTASTTASRNNQYDYDIDDHNDDFTCSGTINTRITARSITTAKQNEIDDLLENILGGDEINNNLVRTANNNDDDESTVLSNNEEGDSSSIMSSLLPTEADKTALTNASSHIQAPTRPPSMEKIPEILLAEREEEHFNDRPQEVYIDSGDDQRASGGGESTTGIRSFRSHSSSSSMMSRSKSQYQHSSASLSRRSKGTLSSDISSSGSSVTTQTVSSILESMGIGPKINENETTPLVPPSNTPSLDAFLDGKGLGDFRSITGSVRKKGKERELRLMNLRAGMVMIFLVSVMFFIVQLGAISKHDLSDRMNSRNHSVYKEALHNQYRDLNRTGSLRGGTALPSGNNIHGSMASRPIFSNNQRQMDTAYDISEVKRKTDRRMTDYINDETVVNTRGDLIPNGAEIVDKEIANKEKSIDNVQKKQKSEKQQHAVVEKSTTVVKEQDYNNANDAPEKKTEEMTTKVVAPVLEVHGPVDILAPATTTTTTKAASSTVITSTSDSLKTSNTQQQQHNKVKTKALLPEEYEYLSKIQTVDLDRKDTPFFWNIPRSGGCMVKEVLSSCLSTVVASEAGVTYGHDSDTDLKTISILGHKFVNVDVSTKDGISHAKDLGLVKSGLPDVIISPFFHESMKLFDKNHHGRSFAMLRHPIERAVSTFEQLKTEVDPTVSSEMTLEDYAMSPHVENNWMVRYLVGKVEGELDKVHLVMAKAILRTKFIVGLSDEKEESMARFENYFNFQPDPSISKECRQHAFTKEGDSVVTSIDIDRKSEAWTLLEWQNKYDIELYNDAKKLFKEQGKKIFKDLDVLSVT